MLVLVAEEDERGDSGGSNLVGILRYKSPDRPDIPVFERREWLTERRSLEKWVAIQWCMTRLKKLAPPIEVIGYIPITDADPKTSWTLSAWNLDRPIEGYFARQADQEQDAAIQGKCSVRDKTIQYLSALAYNR